MPKLKKPAITGELITETSIGIAKGKVIARSTILVTEKHKTHFELVFYNYNALFAYKYLTNGLKIRVLGKFIIDQETDCYMKFHAKSVKILSPE